MADPIQNRVKQLLQMFSQDPNKLGFDDYRLLREQLPDQQSQRLLAPFEHQAFAREYAQSNPLASLGLLGAIPAYQLAKFTGLMSSRSGSGDAVDQMFGGLTGLAQGLYSSVRK